MKNLYSVQVSKSYSKFIDVWAESKEDAKEEAGIMEESGEIEWDYTNDWDKREILSVIPEQKDVAEITKAAKWCKDMVSVAAIIDADWVEEEMEKGECADWLETIRNCGVDIPKPVTSFDLWGAVLAYRVYK